MTDFDGRVGANIRAMRTAAGISQTRLADVMQDAGFAWYAQTVKRVETGVRPLHFAEAAALADYFDMSLVGTRRLTLMLVPVGLT